MALFEPPFETAEENNSGDAAQHHDNLKRLIANHDESGAVKYFLNKTVGVPYLVVAIMRLLPVWNKMKGNAPSLPYDLEITKAFPLKKLMSQPTLPTLIIYGSKTADRLKHAAHSASELIRHSRLARLEGQNHNVSMTVLAPVLIDFFSNTTAST